MRDVRTIAQWERLSGSPAEREAFDYIQRELRKAKVPTRLVEHPALISLPGRASFRLLAADEDLSCITHSFAAPAQSLEAAIVYLDGAAAPRTEVVGGSIVVTDGLAMPGRVAQLQRAQAAAAVFLNRDPKVHEMIVSTVWGSPTPERLADLPTIPVLSMAGTSAARLRHALDGAAAGGAHIRGRISAEVDTAWRTLPLLVADLPGDVEETFILLSGHVDSWYAGAMDNGGANAAMMEIARLFARSKRYRGLRVAFWSGHSHGRYAGSAWYADTHWDELEARCAAHLYIDSVGGRGASLLTSGYCMPETRAVGAAAIKKISGQEYRGSRVGRAGDQSFLGIGIPSLFMTLSEHPKEGPDASRDFAITGSDSGGLGWWWHTAEDTPDKLDPVLLARDTAVYFEAIRTLVGEPLLPLDYGTTAKELLAQLQDLHDRLGDRFDLKPVLEEAQGFERAVGALRNKIQKIGVGRRRHVEEINKALIRIGRALVPVLYTRAGRFEHDPATSIPALPPLAGAEELAGAPAGSPEAHAIAVALTRGRNRLRQALREARSIAEEAAE